MRLVIFDMDGTIIDSVAFIVDTVTEAFSAVGYEPPSEAAIRSISGITMRDAMQILAPWAGPEETDRIAESYRNHYRARAGVDHEPLFPGAREALDRLSADPETILAVATGKGYRSATTLLERHGLLDRFQSVQTPDHNRGKPDPQMIESALQAAGLTKSDAVMIGDTVHDMRMARAGGVGAIGVSWGYHSIDDLRQTGAEIVLDRFEDLDAAVAQLVGRR